MQGGGRHPIFPGSCCPVSILPWGAAEVTAQVKQKLLHGMVFSMDFFSGSGGGKGKGKIKSHELKCIFPTSLQKLLLSFVLLILVKEKRKRKTKQKDLKNQVLCVQVTLVKNEENHVRKDWRETVSFSSS